MLQGMRKHARYFYVLFIIVILSFIFWGVGPLDKPTELTVAEVGKEKITIEEYWRTYENARTMYRQIFRDQFNEELEKKLNLKEAVLESIINERIMLAAAADMGITVSDLEVQDAILSNPQFKRDGVFKKEVYFRTLELNRMTPEQFERSTRQQMAVSKLKSIIWASVDGIPSEVTPGGDTQKAQELSRSLSAKRDLALKSFIEAAKASMQIKVNRERIS
jgi:peptidyl-prolyl cis-trans isomerase D